MARIHLSTNEGLEISSALAGLVGIIITAIGLFLPWGSAEMYLNVLISINGLQANFLMLENYWVVIVFAIEVFGYFLMLGSKRKVSSGVLAAGGSYTIIQTLMWLWQIEPSYSYRFWVTRHTTYVANIGPFATIIGSSFVIFAALLSMLQLKTSTEVQRLKMDRNTKISEG